MKLSPSDVYGDAVMKNVRDGQYHEPLSLHGGDSTHRVFSILRFDSPKSMDEVVCTDGLVSTTGRDYAADRSRFIVKFIREEA